MTAHIFKYTPQTIDAEAVVFMETSLGDFHWQFAQLTSELATNTYIHYWFLKEEGRYVAYVAGQVLFGELEVIRVYTDPLARGRGYGRLLLRQVLSEKGIDVGFLEVRSQNQAAVHLYQGVGFKLMSTRKNYYKHPIDDALTMLWKGE